MQAPPIASKAADMAAHDRVQRLVRAEPSPEPAAVSQHHAEQPDLVHEAGLGGELHLELGKVHLSLLARECLEATLELPRRHGPDQPEILRERGISPL